VSDTLGRISVPDPVDSGALFPLVSDYEYAMSQAPAVAVHRFGAANTKREQRFVCGVGPTTYGFRQHLNRARRDALVSFWESRRGAYETFLYDAPQADRATARVKVNFANEPLSIEHMAIGCEVGLTFVEVPDPASAPVYSVSSTLLRFPDTTLKTALLDQAQELIPLVRIRVREAVVPDIFVSDRRCTIAGQLYQARLLNIGEPGSDVLISQEINGNDDARFTFGNADRAMRLLVNDTELRNATIQLSLYHVQSQILVNFWSGFVQDWQLDAGPEFTLLATDGLYEMMLDYPSRRVSRMCWKKVGDQVTCFAAPGSLCDRSFAGPNGDGALDPARPTTGNCTSLGQTGRFGGILARPQGVRIKDNASGTWGIGRNLVTATSIVSETIQGATLPDIWQNDDGDIKRTMPANCLVADGREEGDFYDGLGIVCRGPLGQYATPQMVDRDGDGKKESFVGHTIDGSPHHGFKVDVNGNPVSGSNNFGLRTALGADPAGTGVDAGVDPSFSLGQGTPQVWTGEERAAGTAFVEVRRVDQKGFQPSNVTEHQMSAAIARGLRGWTWVGPGARAEFPGCDSPFWIAISTFLNGLGLDLADAATQETRFDVDAAVGCAARASALVAALVGDGAEQQFRFKGIIGERKVLRDWLIEILNTALGYYTWSFGRLRLGIRTEDTAGATEAFTAGNMLFNSLALAPVKPRFEKATVHFADQEFAFAANTMEYTEWDHADVNGRVLAPLETEFHLVGCFSKSQALRYAITRVREELGGATPAEWRAARTAAWKSTILALNTEPGTVASVADDDVPGGTAKFRVEKWTLYRDWSTEFQGRTITNSMYDQTAGEKPQDIPADPVPGESGADQTLPPAPLFNLSLNEDDTTAVLISGLQFTDLLNTKSIRSATFEILFSDDATDPRSNLSAGIDAVQDYLDPADLPAGTAAGDYVQFLDTGEVVAILGTARPINKISRSGNVVTVRTDGSHHLGLGAHVTIAGTEDPSFAASGVAVTLTGVNTFTYSQAGDDTVSRGGTATAASIAVTRGALGTDFDNTGIDHTHATDAEMIKLQSAVASETFSYMFFWQGDSDRQPFSVPLPGMRVVGALGYVTNLFGNSPSNAYGLLILLDAKGLQLSSGLDNLIPTF
jgi:hypothetical protein